MKGFAMLRIGEVGWIEKEVPECGPMDAIVRPLAIAICTSDVHTVYEGAIGDRHNMILGHEGCGEVVQFGDTVLCVGIGAVGLMAVAGANLRGASRIIAVGTRPVCVEAAKGYGATDFISYKDGSIEEQVMALTNGKGVDRVCIAGGNVNTFESAIKSLKPGGKIGSVNYLGSGDYVNIPRVEWGCGMGHKQIMSGLMPGGRLRMEKLSQLVASGRLDVKPECTHVFHGWEHVEEALVMMKDKPKDLIKPIVVID
ncbi:MAG: zinc-binding dehydrogenase [Eubacterium sp.]|nr:zinc-binding dehydrogenase [Eubacterium sp.]